MTPPFDRAAHLRTRPDEIAALRADAGYLPSWRNKSLVTRDNPPRPVVLTAAEAEPLRELALDEVFLGLQGGRALFGLRLPDAQAPKHLEGHGDFNDLRGVGPQLDGGTIDLLATVRGLLYWHKHHAFCSSCGGPTQSGEEGFVRICQSCARRNFPRTDPAMMALIVHDERILLARQGRFPPGMYSILAGFVEPGESLEQAVVREVHEEAGLKVKNLRYVKSQSWPFPSSLMLGFVMDAESDAYRLDQDELEEARWASREDLKNPQGFFYPPEFSLSGQLIRMFLDDELP